MDLKLKAALQDAIDNVLNEHAEGDCTWDNYIHPTLTRQMTDAAETVFDAAQAAQTYYISEIA